MLRVCILLFTIFPFTLFAQSNLGQETLALPNDLQPKTVVFVHGSWGGGWDYQHMQTLLEKQGYKVYRPTMTGLGERAHLNSPEVNLDTHINDIVGLFKYEELDDVILVGHSYGGMVISGVAEQIPDKIKHLLYVDALVPEDGESGFSMMAPERAAYFKQLAKDNTDQPWAIPPFWPDWGKDVPQPMGTYEQTITLTNPKVKNIPTTFILALHPELPQPPFAKYAKRAKDRGWNIVELPTDHNIHRTMPNEYVEIIKAIE